MDGPDRENPKQEAEDVSSVHNQPPPSLAYDHPRESHAKRHDWATTWAGIAALFAVVSALVSYWQWDTMRAANGLTERSLELTRHALELSSRAWVVVKDLKNTSGSRGRTRTKFTLFNAGGSPALVNMYTAYTVAPADLKEAPDLAWPGDPAATITIGPGVEVISVVEMPVGVNRERFEAGVEALYILGLVQYSDPLSAHRLTRSCWLAKAVPGAPGQVVTTACPFHNDFE